MVSDKIKKANQEYIEKKKQEIEIARIKERVNKTSTEEDSLIIMDGMAQMYEENTENSLILMEAAAALYETILELQENSAN